jgi:hypothetical protein
MTDEAPPAPTFEQAQAAASAEAEALRTQAAYELARTEEVLAVLTGESTAAFLTAIGDQAEQLLPGVVRTELQLIVSDISQRVATIRNRRAALQLRLNPLPVNAIGGDLTVAP